MKKNTSLKLSKQLVKYGALTIAIAGVADVNGQIIYTDFPDHIGVLNGGFLLDLDNNGIDDFRIHTIGSSYSSFFTGVVVTPLGSNEVLGSGGGLVFADKLNLNDPISSGGTVWNNAGNQLLNYGYSYSCSSGTQWCQATDGYLGLRFKIGADFHYGWARLDTGNDGNSWTVKDMAYDSGPNETILAGVQTTLSVDVIDILNEVRIVALNKSIRLYNLSKTTGFKIYSMSGKQILEGTVSNADSIIEAKTLTSGVFIIELTDIESKAVIRKKIVL